MTEYLNRYIEGIQVLELTRRVGRVCQLSGLSIHVEGLKAAVGELCRIYPAARTGAAHDDQTVLAEVVGIGIGTICLMPFGQSLGISAGDEVVAESNFSEIEVGYELLGRVIDGFGNPLDDFPKASMKKRFPLKSRAVNPMRRPRIDSILQTGVKAIDGLLTLGKGQRVGIFAGSGVGKSTLLGMIAKHVKADINVIALIGERGREVKEFIEKQLGDQGLSRSVVVVATSDQPALSRIRAVYAGLAIAEFFRSEGKQVLLMMDSITRFAMAKREVGLSAGEPPTARGYTPSVFAELPELCERCGTSDSGGAISALMTVLVEGDDLNEPVSDSLRSILDGHIVLSRDLAHRGQYPAIDVLKSASRVMLDLVAEDDLELSMNTIKQLAVLHRNRQMVDIGAYEKGSNPVLDNALAIESDLFEWLRQKNGGIERDAAIESLRGVVSKI